MKYNLLVKYRFIHSDTIAETAERVFDLPPYFEISSMINAMEKAMGNGWIIVEARIIRSYVPPSKEEIAKKINESLTKESSHDES